MEKLRRSDSRGLDGPKNGNRKGGEADEYHQEIIGDLNIFHDCFFILTNYAHIFNAIHAGR